MKYALAKKLKDAGFYQDFHVNTQRYVYLEGTKLKAKFSEIHKHLTNEKGVMINCYETLITIPTLEELIEACGGKFIQLVQTPAGEWIAIGQIEEQRINTMKALGGEFEKTPLEAVALLLLELNEKTV